ncbi:MAG: LytTR family transcriptional regulator DNA-binding domain-containing protein [Clostridiales bacterium]|jgi:DNA-binding LytR/AlgR family response regulator|nr:LytTR family transcriptional regulator DNA-binding domain-containing protein [Clostridiales bacterium]
MRVRFEQVDSPEKEEALIRAQIKSDDIKAAIEILEGNQRKIPLIKDGNNVFIDVSALYYIESVDKKSFVYTKQNCYETRLRLYELEETLGAYFLRVSKSMIVNLRKIKGVKSDISGRMEATLLNDEKIVISRSYVKEIKRRLDI